MLKPTNLSPFRHFCMTIGHIPTSYKDSMTYYEMLNWLCKYLEETVIPAVDNNAEALTELQALFKQLKEYVDNYFTTTDFQELVNTKLDEMAEDGTLADIINIEIFNKKVDTFNQDSEMTRIFRLIDSSLKVISALHITDTSIYMALSDNSSTILYKLDKSNYSVDSSTQLDYVVTDISELGSNILVLDGTNEIRQYNKTTLVYGSSINLTTPVLYCEKDEDTYFLVDSLYNVKTTTDFVLISDYELHLECNAITVKDHNLYALKDNSLEMYKDKVLTRVHNQALIVNNGFIKGLSKAIATDGEKFIVGTYKKLIPIREDYVFSLYEMNLSSNVKAINKLLNYNSARNEFEVYYNSSNTSVNPDGTQTNGFSNIYECIEVALNGNYNKGNIIFKNANEEIDDLFISDMYKKVGIYCNGATINGMLIRNSAKVEVNNATIDGEYLTNGYVLGFINSDVVITDTVTINNSNALENVIEATYKSVVSILTPVTNGNILSRTGSIISTRNNSYYDKKIIGDRYSNFLPSVCLLDSTGLDAGNSVTVTGLSNHTEIELRINLNGKFIHSKLPVINGTYCLTHSAVTSGGAMFIGNMDITLNGDTITLNSTKVTNITSGSVATPTYRIVAIFGR